MHDTWCSCAATCSVHDASSFGAGTWAERTSNWNQRHSTVRSEWASERAQNWLIELVSVRKMERERERTEKVLFSLVSPPLIGISRFRVMSSLGHSKRSTGSSNTSETIYVCVCDANWVIWQRGKRLFHFNHEFDRLAFAIFHFTMEKYLRRFDVDTGKKSHALHMPIKHI